MTINSCINKKYFIINSSPSQARDLSLKSTSFGVSLI